MASSIDLPIPTNAEVEKIADGFPSCISTEARIKMAQDILNARFRRATRTPHPAVEIVNTPSHFPSEAYLGITTIGRRAW